MRNQYISIPFFTTRNITLYDEIRIVLFLVTAIESGDANSQMVVTVSAKNIFNKIKLN
jgi:hypothetical protein